MSPPGFERGDQWSTISWYAPSCLILEFGVSKHNEPKEKGTGYFALHLLTPETQHTMHYFYGTSRNYALEDPEIDEAYRRFQRDALKAEDSRVSEAIEIGRAHV